MQRAHRARQEAREVEHADTGEGPAFTTTPRLRRSSACSRQVSARDPERAFHCDARVERVVQRFAEARDVPHLASAPRLALAVRDEASRADARAPSASRARAASSRRRRNQMSPSRFTITAGVCWCGSPIGEAGQHARLLLELRSDARVDRVVAAVVRARCDLVDQQLARVRRRTSRRTARRDSRARAATSRRDVARLR